MNSHIKYNLKETLDSISTECINSNREIGEVKLLAVSKTFPIEDVKTAYECGQLMFGENKVQELEKKVPNLPNNIEWHLIGHLQSNKVAKAVELADYIHAVDSIKLIKRIDKLSEEARKSPKFMLEVNISGEESKFGVTIPHLSQCAEAAGLCKHAKFVGLMTMAPFDADEKVLTDIFSTLRKLRGQLQSELNLQLPELSMGMSSDFNIAIKEGATMVRIGTSIFGKRSYSEPHNP